LPLTGISMTISKSSPLNQFHPQRDPPYHDQTVKFRGCGSTHARKLKQRIRNRKGAKGNRTVTFFRIRV
jgi:hypothetical protein